MPLPTLAPRLPGNPQPVTERLSTKEHTEAEWEAKRQLIKKLYIGDNRKLSEIMAILESKHGFAATWVSPMSCLTGGASVDVEFDLAG